MKKRIAYIIANFGGPRNLEEIEPFLKQLLTDGDVIRTRLPNWLQNYLFKCLAKKRAKAIAVDYQSIGGKSPIFDDTEAIAKELSAYLDGPILTFHRYLPTTHSPFREQLKKLDCNEIRVFPLFPQFTYATTGSIARWFDNYLPEEIVKKLRWVKSYPAHPGFIAVQKQLIRKFLQEHQLKDEESILLFSAHGVPKSFIKDGDIYLDECNASYEKVMEAFPNCMSRLSFQSQFGKEEWIRPYTSDVCEEILSWNEGRKNVIFIPITFTSDHIETLYEMEQLYIPVIREKGLHPYRVPALTLDPQWMATIPEILKNQNYCSNQMLIRWN